MQQHTFIGLSNEKNTKMSTVSIRDEGESRIHAKCVGRINETGPRQQNWGGNKGALELTAKEDGNETVKFSIFSLDQRKSTGGRRKGLPSLTKQLKLI